MSAEANKKQIQRPNPPVRKQPELTPLELISARNLTVFHQNKLLKKAVQGLCALVVMCFGVIFVLAQREPQDNFFATTPEGVITKIEPLSKPMLTNAQVSRFAIEAVTETMSITYVDYERKLSESQEYYRPDVFATILDEIRNSGFLKDVTSGLYIATAVPIEAPLIVREGDRGGVYAWEVTFPIAVKLLGRNDSKSQLYDAAVVVERAPSEIRPRSIAVTRLLLNPR